MPEWLALEFIGQQSNMGIEHVERGRLSYSQIRKEHSLRCLGLCARLLEPFGNSGPFCLNFVNFFTSCM
jgi:hypothetical protein